jgi:hypothetical protein
MVDINEMIKQKEFERFEQAIGDESDPTMLVLRAHLFTEYLLERLITFKLPRGDKVIESGNLTYNQKLVLVDSLERLPDSIISSLRNLNKLRNQCAHELDKKITDSDVTRIGSTIGKKFSQYRKDAKFDHVVLLRSVINYICGYVTATCNEIEHPELFVSTPPAAQPRPTSSATRITRKPRRSQPK